MQGIFDALTAGKQTGYLLHGGSQWKCAAPADPVTGLPTNHIVATLAGDADTVYAVGNHKPLNVTDAEAVAAEAAHDAAVQIDPSQPQLSPTNLTCFCGQKVSL